MGVDCPHGSLAALVRVHAVRPSDRRCTVRREDGSPGRKAASARFAGCPPRRLLGALDSRPQARRRPPRDDSDRRWSRTRIRVCRTSVDCRVSQPWRSAYERLGWRRRNHWLQAITRAARATVGSTDGSQTRPRVLREDVGPKQGTSQVGGDPRAHQPFQVWRSAQPRSGSQDGGEEQGPRGLSGDAREDRRIQAWQAEVTGDGGQGRRLPTRLAAVRGDTTAAQGSATRAP